MTKKYRTKEQILIDIKTEKLKEILDSMGDGDAPEYDYIGKTVKINKESYETRIKNGELSKGFADGYKANKDRELTVKSITMFGQYEIEEHEFWTFNKYNLLAPCDDCGEFINMNLYLCPSCGKDYTETE